jgi:hypothetical protein
VDDALFSLFVTAGLILAATLLTLALGMLVLRVSPRGSDGRRVAAVLLAECLALVLAGTSAIAADRSPAVGAFFRVSALCVMLALGPLELVMLGRVPSRATAWVRGRERVILVVPLTLIALFLVGSVTSALGVDLPIDAVAFPLATALAASYAVMPFFGLIVAVSAWRKATSPASRDRSKWFAIAFGARDAILLFFVVVMALINVGPASLSGSCGGAQCPTLWGWLAYNTFTLPVLAVVVYTPLLAYGILKSRVFDIDLRLKDGLRAGTIGAFFLVAFFVAEQIGQQLISERAGPYVGLAGAGILALAILPLRRFAHRMVEKAMPRIDGSPEYVASRKREVYAAAADEALADGVIDDADRALLSRLATDLLLPPQDMVAIETAASEHHAAASSSSPRDDDPPRPTDGTGG